MGAVYCRKMALAAVVRSLATMKRVTVAAYAVAIPSWRRDQVKTGRFNHAQRTIAASPLRAPAFASEGQSTLFTSTPPRLQSTEQTMSRSTAERWDIGARD